MRAPFEAADQTSGRSAASKTVPCALKQELQLASNADFFAGAVALFSMGCFRKKIGAWHSQGEPKRRCNVLVFHLSNNSRWISRYRASRFNEPKANRQTVAELVSSPDASPPTPAIAIAVMAG